VEKLTEQEKKFLIYIGYLVLDNDRLRDRLISEVQNEFADIDPDVVETLFEKLDDLVE
jgi:hypothetical protein